jgi:hypothetical protein
VSRGTPLPEARRGPDARPPAPLRPPPSRTPFGVRRDPDGRSRGVLRPSRPISPSRLRPAPAAPRSLPEPARPEPGRPLPVSAGLPPERPPARPALPLSRRSPEPARPRVPPRVCRPELPPERRPAGSPPRRPDVSPATPSSALAVVLPQPTQRRLVGCSGRAIFRVRGSSLDGVPARTQPGPARPAATVSPDTAVRAASVRTEATLTHDVRRRPTLPRGPPRSTIGAEELNFRVRNGTGCFPFAMTAETLWRFRSSAFPEDWPPSGAADRTSGTAQWTRPFRGSGGRPPGQHSAWESPPRRDV